MLYNIDRALKNYHYSKENAKEVAERFSQLMIDAAKDLVVPSKCDVEVTECWYGEPLQLDE